VIVTVIVMKQSSRESTPDRPSPVPKLVTRR
jgi:hypothetical protein